MDVTGAAMASQNSPMRHSGADSQSNTAATPQTNIHIRSKLTPTTPVSATTQLTPRCRAAASKCATVPAPWPCIHVVLHYSSASVLPQLPPLQTPAAPSLRPTLC